MSLIAVCVPQVRIWDTHDGCQTRRTRILVSMYWSHQNRACSTPRYPRSDASGLYSALRMPIRYSEHVQRIIFESSQTHGWDQSRRFSIIEDICRPSPRSSPDTLSIGSHNLAQKVHRRRIGNQIRTTALETRGDAGLKS